MPLPSHPTEIAGRLEKQGMRTPLRVVKAQPYALIVAFENGAMPASGTAFDRIVLSYGGRDLVLGACRFELHPDTPRRRKDDRPAEPGDGRLLFTEAVYDFTTLLSTGRAVDLDQKVKQLPLLWRRRGAIKPSFQKYAIDLLYDLQVYRSLFDELDRHIDVESEADRAQIHDIVIRSQYERFAGFLDDKLAQLEHETRDFSKTENELHGFFFRKQLWDIILCSEFMARTNLKPRGYAGDSLMMQMLYENEFRGRTIFSKFMHRHPLQHAAAQAVRNRRDIVSGRIRDLSHCAARHGNGGPALRVLSVACGPASELRDVFKAPEDASKIELVLLDQDSLAIQEARLEIQRIEQRLAGEIRAKFIRGSVRTLHQTMASSQDPGKFHFLYAMGLFDYLIPPVAKMVLTQLYDLVTPGGQMLIGNFHPKNPSRTYMDYWHDWVLFYRSEDELLALAHNLPGAECTLFFEKAQAQMFLEVRKT